MGTAFHQTDQAVSCSPNAGCVFGRPNVPGKGSLLALAMFIGQAPNEASIQAQQPWVGSSGNTLRQWLTRLGMKEEEVYLTNAVKCVAWRKYPGYADQIAYNQKKACCQWLKNEIKDVRPKVVIPLGSSALQILFQDASMTISKFRERFGWSHRTDEVVYFPLHHPSYEARNPDVFKRIVEEWAELHDLIKIYRA